MDRGAWGATVHGVPRVGHNLVTKPPTTKMCSFQLKIHQEIITKKLLKSDENITLFREFQPRVK